MDQCLLRFQEVADRQLRVFAIRLFRDFASGAARGLQSHVAGAAVHALPWSQSHSSKNTERHPVQCIGQPFAKHPNVHDVGIAVCTETGFSIDHHP